MYWISKDKDDHSKNAIEMKGYRIGLGLGGNQTWACTSSLGVSTTNSQYNLIDQTSIYYKTMSHIKITVTR